MMEFIGMGIGIFGMMVGALIILEGAWSFFRNITR